jgi:hypothetical protein
MSIRIVSLAVALSLVCSLSCGMTPISLHATYDDEIPDEDRSAIAALDARVDAAVANGDVSSILELVPDEYRDKWGGETRLAALLRSFKQEMPNAVATPWHLVKAEFGGVLGQVRMLPPRDLNAPKAFFLHLDAVRRTSITSLRTISIPPDQVLMVTVYVSEEDGFRLYGMHWGALQYLGRDAVDWFDEARHLRETSGPVAASVRAVLASRLLRPVPYMQYVREAEVKKLAAEIQAEVQAEHPFPRALPGPEPQPSLLSYDSRVMDGALAVVLNYLPTASLEETSTVEAEARAMHPKVLEVLPGLCEGAGSVVYRAFEEPPSDPQRAYRSYGTIVPCGVSR